jgi:uncharacterized lipoprotein YehR (DUF1307 family)
MKSLVALLALIVVALPSGCGKKEETKKPDAGASSGNPITAPVDYLGAVGKAKTTVTKNLDLANVSQAVKMFEAAEERLPKNLGELVEKGYLPKLPVAPQGFKLTYDATTGQVKMAPAQ